MARNKFTSEQGRAAGKKSKRKPGLSSLKDIEPINAGDIKKIISMYMRKSLEELEAIASDKSLAAIEAIVIRCMLQSLRKGDFGGVESMLQRVMGKVENKNINENIEVERDKALDKVPREDLIRLAASAGD